VQELLNDSLARRTLGSIDQLEGEALRRALDLWRSKAPEGGLPARADFDPSEMVDYLGNVVLVDIEHDPRRYRYRLIGTDITRVTGRDMSGRYWDQVYHPSDIAVLSESLDRVLETRMPVRSTGSMKWVEKDYISVEIVDLPLASDGVEIDMVLRVIVFGG